MTNRTHRLQRCLFDLLPERRRQDRQRRYDSIRFQVGESFFTENMVRQAAAAAGLDERQTLALLTSLDDTVSNWIGGAR